MLGTNTYDRGYVDAARSAFAERVRAFDVLPEDTRGLADFEPVYFATLVVALDHYFSHPTDGPEESPLNEVRALATAIMSNESDRPITSIEFSRLSKAFFDELERRSA
jgi:hypothetical protein